MASKKRIKEVIYAYEVRITSKLTNMIAIRASKREILRSCRQDIVHYNLSDNEKGHLWLLVQNLYRKLISAAARELDEQKRQDNIYTVLRKQFPILEHQKNEIADIAEERLKRDELRDLVRSGEHFCYCDEHKNCAKDHLQYQGKIYYVARNYDEMSDVEKQYIRAHKLLSVEEATTESPYLCTRRNCKHHMIPVDLGDIEKDDYRHVYDTHSISYNESQYHVYFDRLKLLNRLKDDGLDCPKLNSDIDCTRNLVKQWYRAWKEADKKRGL